MAATLPPDADQVRARSELLTAKYPAADPDPLDPFVEDAVALVQGWTGRILDPAHPENAASNLVDVMEQVPPGLVPVAVRAVALTAEMLSVAGETKEARRRGTRQRLRSISAGPWSETYWGPDGRTAGQRPRFTDDPDLDALLWQLATQDARDALVAETSGVQPPAGMASTTDFNRQPGVGFGGIFGAPGPDGW